MTMHGEMLGERTRARPPMRSAETEAAAISIATPRIPPGRDVAWVSVTLERAEQRGSKFVIAARSRRRRQRAKSGEHSDLINVRPCGFTLDHPADRERGGRGRTRPPRGKERARRGAGGSLSTRPSVVTLHTPERPIKAVDTSTAGGASMRLQGGTAGSRRP